jgi:hypothetical protein
MPFLSVSICIEGHLLKVAENNQLLKKHHSYLRSASVNGASDKRIG